MSSKLYELPDDKLKEKMWSEIGLNRQRIKESVEILKKWMQQQPHLPEDYDDRRLERFLLDSKNSMEKAKSSIDLYYTLKGLCPDLMSGWDIKGKWLESLQKAIYGYVGRKLTSEGDRIYFLTFTKDVENFDIIALGKLAVIFAEIRKAEDYCRSDVIICDCINFSMAHVQKITLPVLKKLQVILLKAYKIRITTMHFLNVPSYAEIVINAMKSVLKKKIALRLKIHGSDLTNFYSQVPKELLPSDLGGGEESVDDNMERWRIELESKREWLMEREKIKSNEMKRPGKAVNSDDIFGFAGTFRTLDVD